MAEHEALCYEAAHGKLVHIRGCSFEWNLANEPDGLKFNFCLKSCHRWACIPDKIDLDLASFVDGVQTIDALPGERCARDRIGEHGGKMTTILSMSHEPVVEQVELKGQDALAFTLQDIRLGKEVADDLTAFLPADTLRGLEVNEVKLDTQRAMTDFVNAFIQSLSFRKALTQKEMRQLFNQELTDAQWNALAETDANNAKRLRAIPEGGVL